MKQIHIPFKERFREKIQTGIKTMTSRTRKYGEPGDYFYAFGVKCVLKSVKPVPLITVKCVYWREEGVESSEEFEEVWNNIHPGKGFSPQQVVFLHEWELE